MRRRLATICCACSPFASTSGGTILYSSTATCFEHLLGLIGVLDVRQFDQDAVAADVADRRLGNTEAVDAVVDDLARLRLNLGRDLRHFGRRIQLKQQTRSALQIETEMDLLMERRDRPNREDDDRDNNQRLNGVLSLFQFNGVRRGAVQTNGPGGRPAGPVDFNGPTLSGLPGVKQPARPRPVPAAARREFAVGEDVDANAGAQQEIGEHRPQRRGADDGGAIARRARSVGFDAVAQRERDVGRAASAP